MSSSLRSLSDREILSRTRAVTVQERESTLLVLLHLNEIERRRLHLKQGYSSMFDYCTSGLGYSASAASRRIKTARCVARLPEVYGLLESNAVNISTIAQVWRILTRENKDEILFRIRGKSQREVEAIVAEYEPRAVVPADRVRTVVVRVPLMGSAARGGTVRAEADSTPTPPAAQDTKDGRNGCAADAPAEGLARPAGVGEAGETDEYNRNGCTSSPGGVVSAARLERRVLIQFSAGEAFMSKLERVRSLSWHRLPANASFEQVFELVLDEFIERKDPGARRERRASRASKRPAGDGSDTATRGEAQESTTVPQPVVQQARYVPARVRDEVVVRDRGRCTFVGPTGRRCASTNALQIDHITPVARGGASTPDNLRVLCAYHNHFEAERLMGRRGARDGPPAR